MKEVKGLFVGLTTIDYIYYVDEYPDNNTKCKTGDYARYVGGPAANAAITYALLGGKAILITCIGNSLEGKMAKEILAKYNVKVIDCVTDDEMPNISTISVDKDGNRTIFSGQNQFMNVSVPENFNEDYDFCLFDLNQQNVALKVLENIKCNIVIDAGSWKGNTEQFLKQADIIISSEKFADKDGKSIFQIQELSGALKAITRGEKDILLENDTISVEQVECIDSLAAGDIFHGAFCYGYYNKKATFKGALEYASKVATVSVRNRGPRTFEILHI